LARRSRGLGDVYKRQGHASATYLDEPGRRAGVIQAFNGDPLSATRRAIVRAAAEMAPDGMPF
jgi:hypothetical protein